MRRLSIFIVLTFLVFSSSGQDIAYVRAVIKKLCSPEFHGRGYELDGNKKAADYLISHVKSVGLDSLNGGYYQRFAIDVNTFPRQVALKINGSKLFAGSDFLVQAHSSSYKGRATVISLNSLKSDSLFLDELTNKDFVVLLDNKTDLQTAFAELQRFGDKLRYFRGVIKNTPTLGAHYQAGYALPFVDLVVVEKYVVKQGDVLTINIENEFKKQYQTGNIIARIAGETDTAIVIAAHYDHIGRLGKHAYFPGAHDNASGTAMALDLMRHFKKTHPNFKYTLVLMLFSAEEIGLLGSEYYCRNPLFPLSKIKFLLNLDLVASGEEGITVVNGSVCTREFDLLTRINNDNNYLTKIVPRGEARNSDHYHFHENGVSSFFIYTLGAYKEYHNVNDRAENLPMPVYDNFFHLLTLFILSL